MPAGAWLDISMGRGSSIGGSLARVNCQRRGGGRKWHAPGDKVTVVIRRLGREVAVNMTLTQFQKDSRVTCVNRQQGLPDVRHERRFKAVPKGFEFRPVVAFQPRSGPAGLFDRGLVRRAVAGALRRTVVNLDGRRLTPVR
jgi:hypothetical protein